MKLKTGFTALMVAGLLAGCAAPTSKQSVSTQTCKVENQMQQTTLYYGLTRQGGKPITAQEWQQYVDNDVTPRFRDGLTAFDAQGQWLGSNGKVSKEPSKALMLIHSVDAQTDAKIDTLREIYKSRFAQESVMRVDQPVCVQF
ncbi:DUF3574 domain-containing protein [Kosakonia sp. MUSA4]|uniref:DUF3574 domain-containing protein n=1 Tax=Kosakonia sp. MUSA4 TaxID=2067958 RepID=UPI0008C0D65F|nr:DUF3574 domain-containing protein [Kosakonia sp. MUSA4]QJT80185.1 DUF3574 domain-containing protein [Kosakonia sp. MUSA4]SEK77733.1 Protein of unknown function [Kosakonia sacchari]